MTADMILPGHIVVPTKGHPYAGLDCVVTAIQRWGQHDPSLIVEPCISETYPQGGQMKRWNVKGSAQVRIVA